MASLSNDRSESPSSVSDNLESPLTDIADNTEPEENDVLRLVEQSVSLGESSIPDNSSEAFTAVSTASVERSCELDSSSCELDLEQTASPGDSPFSGMSNEPNKTALNASVKTSCEPDSLSQLSEQSASYGSELVPICDLLTSLNEETNTSTILTYSENKDSKFSHILLCDLPECALLHIFQFLNIRTLVLVVRKTCWMWYHLSFDRSLWKTLKLDCGGFGERLGDGSFLKMMTPIADLVEEIVFGFSMLLTDEAFMHRDIHLSNIKTLDFSLTNVTTNAVIFLTDKYPNLTSLNLNHCSYINIFKCLDYLTKFQGLKYLSFEDFACPADEHKLNEKILNMFRSCRSIAGCDIYTTELSDTTLSGIFESSPHLKELDLTGADKLSVKGFKTLDKDIHSLTHLSIAYTMINDAGLKIITENSPKLKSLNIMSCVCITDAGIGYISNNCKELETFLLNKTDPEEKGCSITSNGLEMISLGCPKLKVLYVSYCLLIDDRCIIAVAKNCPRLSELRLAGCLPLTDACLVALGEYSKFLSDLEMSECTHITSKGVGFLIGRCRWLQSFSLETCHRVSDIRITQTLDKEDKADKNSCIDFVAPKADKDKNDSVEIALKNESHACYATGNDARMDDVLTADLLSDDKTYVDDVTTTAQNVYSLEVSGLDNLTKEPESAKCTEHLGMMNVALKALANHSHLSSIHLSFCSQVTNDSIIEIAHHCPDLKELSLRGCHLITDIAIVTLVRCCQFIRALDLSGGSSFFSMKISNVSLSAVAHECQYIERLMISKNKMINLSGLEVLFSKCKSLESLELTVGEPMYASFSGVMSLINGIDDRIVKIANHVQVIANKQSGNLHIEFYPNPGY